jgi:hypothetical protein
MARELQNMEGTLRKNDKPQSDKSPTLKGRMIVDGKGYWISGWKKTFDDGEFVINLKYTAMEEKPQVKNDMENEIPW